MLAIDYELAIRVCEVGIKRILRSLGLARRNNYSEIGDVIEYVQGQIKKSGMLHGYRWMYQFHCNCSVVRDQLILISALGAE